MDEEVRRQRVLDAVQNNMEQVVRFVVEGTSFTRRLVWGRVETVAELSVESPVGRALRNAQPGDRMRVEAPGGCVEVSVLEVL